MQDSSNAGEHRIAHEIMRITDNGSNDAADFFLVVPLINEADALAFLSTVPTGSDLTTIQAMAAVRRG